MARVVEVVASAWSVIGLLVAVPFLLFGAARVLDAARGASIPFRLLALPSCVVLWPLVLMRWVRGPVRS